MAARQAWVKRPPVGASVACGALLLLAALQCVGWIASITNAGGLERYVRHTIDFRSTLTGALIIAEGNGQSLYDLPTQHAAQERVVAPYYVLGAETTLPYIHMPLEALLTAPLLRWPYELAYAFWTVLALLSIAASCWLLARNLAVSATTRWLLVAATCAYTPLYLALFQGQPTPLVLLGLCGAFAAVRAGRDGLAGAFLALMLLKPQLAVGCLVVLVLQRRWRTLLVTAALWGAIGVAAMPFLGVLWPLDYASFLASTGGWGESQGEHPLVMHNWRALVLNLLGQEESALVGLLVGLLSAGSLCLIVWSWRRNGRTASSVSSATGVAGSAADLTWALAVVVTPLIAQHLYVHDLLLLVFPAWIVAAYATSPDWAVARPQFVIAFLWVGFALPLVAMLAAEPETAAVASVTYLGLALVVLVWQAGTLHSRRLLVCGSPSDLLPPEHTNTAGLTSSPAVQPRRAQR